MTRRICYVSGTRADFGLMKVTLAALHAAPGLSVDILVTGMHLSEAHGLTVQEIRAADLPIRGEVPVTLEPATGATMARNLGVMVQHFVDYLEPHRPDAILLLGDRGEMLAGAIAAIHLNIPVVHIHGGERSGTVDEPVRHAISKLSHIHFVATAESRERLVRMGEHQEHVFVTGAPGLDGLQDLASVSRVALCGELDFEPQRLTALMVFHPVLQEADKAGESAEIVMTCLVGRGFQVVAMMPNSDGGSDPIRQVLLSYAQDKSVRVLTHLNRAMFVSWVACCDVMIGNSSAGIIEAASFGTPVLNLGNRQNLRERNANTLDVPLEKDAILVGLDQLLKRGRQQTANIYGDGHASTRIVELMSTLPLSSSLLSKTNAY